METAMTVALDYTPSFYIADGQTKEFQYNFSLTMTSNLVVFTMDKRGEKTIVDKGLYDFKINPDNTGGAVTFDKAPESGTNVLIARIETPTQEKDWRNTEGFNLKSLTDEFDKLTRWCQELAENNKRSIVVPENKEDDPLDLYNRMIISDELESVKFLKNENGNLYYSLDGEIWTMLPKSAMIQELRQRTVLDEHQVPHTVFEYRIGDKWYDVMEGVSHTGLLDRDAEDSHPISAITNLQSELDKKANGADVYDKSETYSKEEVDTALGKKANASTTYSKTEVDNALAKKLNIQQGASNVGKILKVGVDGNIIASSESAGLASVNHDDTLEGAGTDSSPLVIAGKEKLTNKITNCILQLPQNIKLTLNGNQLTLASGSTYYVPNGVGKFNAVTTSTDITYTARSNGTRLLLMNSTGTNMDAPNIASCFSQGSQPSGNSIYWWDLTNNLVKSIVSGSVAASGISLPIALLTVDGDNVTIEKIFNGVGFMGTTIYTTPDLLVAVPNGRNSDGTLKNATAMQTRVNVYTLESFTRTELYAASTQLLAVGENTYTYDFVQNKILTGTGDQRTFVKIGTVSNNGTYITNIDLDEPFAAVDYNEYAKDLSNINEMLEDKASLSEPQTIKGKYTFTQTIDTNNSLGLQINRALDSNGTTAWRVYDATNSRQIRSVGFYANSKIYNRLSIVGGTGVEGYLNFSMTDDGTMNIELGGTSGVKEYLPSKGANNASFATTKWVQRELGDYAQNDLSNVSAEGIDTAVGWGIPDYSAGVDSSTVPASFTCDQDYLFIFFAYAEGTHVGSMSVRIDNTPVADITSSNSMQTRFPIYARKGSVVTTAYMSLTIASCTRYPLLKGA